MTKNLALVIEARRWTGITEIGKDNSGQLVELFQKIIGGAHQESWCMSFVQYCLHWIDRYYPEDTHDIFKSENCLEVWTKSPAHCKLINPIIGSVVIWNYKGTTSGHTGIVVDSNFSSITTIEGNTSSKDVMDREGDGVFEKVRNKGDLGKIKLLGYLNPWP